MDKLIAVIIIVVAGWFVLRKLGARFKARKGGGCGCSDSCAAGRYSCSERRDGEDDSGDA